MFAIVETVSNNNSRSNNAAVLQEYGYPMDQITIGVESTNVPVGSCPVPVTIHHGKPYVLPFNGVGANPENTQDPPPAIGYTYAQLLANAEKLGYGYCFPEKA